MRNGYWMSEADIKRREREMDDIRKDIDRINLIIERVKNGESMIKLEIKK